MFQDVIVQLFGSIGHWTARSYSVCSIPSFLSMTAGFGSAKEVHWANASLLLLINLQSIISIRIDFLSWTARRSCAPCEPFRWKRYFKVHEGRTMLCGFHSPNLGNAGDSVMPSVSGLDVHAMGKWNASMSLMLAIGRWLTFKHKTVLICVSALNTNRKPFFLSTLFSGCRSIEL